MIILGSPILIPGTEENIGGKRLSTNDKIIARQAKMLKKVSFCVLVFINYSPSISTTSLCGRQTTVSPVLEIGR